MHRVEVGSVFAAIFLVVLGISLFLNASVQVTLAFGFAAVVAALFAILDRMDERK